MSFQLRIRGSRLRVRLEKERIEFTVVDGGPVELAVRGASHTVNPGAPVTVVLDGQGEDLPDLEGSHPVVGSQREDGTVIQATVPESTDQ